MTHSNIKWILSSAAALALITGCSVTSNSGTSSSATASATSATAETSTSQEGTSAFDPTDPGTVPGGDSGFDPMSGNTPSTPEQPTETPVSETTQTEVSTIDVSSYEEISVTEDLGDFTITTDVTDGYTQDGTIYTITKAGTYTLSGTLEEGQIYVSAGDDDKVTLSLDGVNITSSENSPIFVTNADKVTISAKSGTTSSIQDLREHQSEDTEDETIGAAAIYATCDMDVQGQGNLVVNGNYNNGISTKDDLTIKNLSLDVTGYNNALKGSDSLTIKSGTIRAISTGGDALKTSNSDISSKGNQRGTIDIQGGTLYLYAAQDAIDASYDVLISEASEEANIYIYTDTYSSYSGEVTTSSENEIYLRIPSQYYYSSDRYAMYFYNSDGTYLWEDATFSSTVSSQSQGGRPGGSSTYYLYKLDRPSDYESFKVYCFSSTQSENSTDTYKYVTSGASVNYEKDMFAVSRISGTTITGSWSTYSTSSQQGGSMSGTTSQGNGLDYSTKGIKADNEITIDAGTIKIQATDDAIHANSDTALENSETPLGNVTINGGTLEIASGDDGIHADNTLTINGGNINITKAYEGIEGCTIVFNGGTSYVVASDDGVNASGTSPSILVTGGYLDVTVPSGDVDGIDSNGTYKQTGGFVISRDSTSQSGGVASGLDTDGTVTINGGTFICAGAIAETPSSSSTNCLVKWGSSSGSGGMGGFGGGGWGGSSSSVTFAAGDYSIEGTTITFSLSSSYSALWISSDQFTVGSSYTLSGGTTKTWTQSSTQTSAS